MDKNSIIGFVLIFALIIAWQQLLKPSQAEIEKQQRIQDSIQLAEARADSIAQLEVLDTQAVEVDSAGNVIVDSTQNVQLVNAYGIFANAAAGQEKEVVLENDLLKITFTNKGGRIKDVLLKEYFKMSAPSEGENKLPLHLLDDDKNRFEYQLPTLSAASASVSTGDLFFDVQESENSITFRANAQGGGYFEQTYTINDAYTIDYDINLNGLGNSLKRDAKSIELNWVNYLDKLERNQSYERTMSSIYYKEVEDDATYCSCTSDDQVTLDEERIEWISNANQFFNSALIAKNEPFAAADFDVKVYTDEDDDLKRMTSKLAIPYDARASSNNFAMQMYVGPKEYDRLLAFNNEMEYTVPFGVSIFGTVNRYLVRPLFAFLSSFIGNAGIVILVLTLLVKLLLYPLTYRMLYSQSKMAALKPQMEKVREKYKEDPQQQQMETMKMYREFGVNPLGGCMPMVAQMPIWIALYRFFPSAIEFRQTPFLWANDLSSFDVFAQLPFEVPFYGTHVSLFTLLWALTTVAYVWYNSRHMDMSAMNSNPAMKYMQYFMPLMFVFFFNSFASGLTAYLFFSNLTNIAQTLITKNFIISKSKIEKELEEYRKKPKKKGGFQQRLEEAMKQQQAIQEQRANKSNRGTSASRRNRKK